MKAKQLSVFIENRQGRLGEVLKVLKDNKVNIMSLSIADTTEYGLLRLIVDKPEDAKNALSKNGFSAMLSEILIIQISHQSGSLQTLLTELTDQKINIEYMYGLTTEGACASVVLKSSDLGLAEKVLTDIDVKTLSIEDLVK